jgi:hypothetical protein
VLRVLLFVAFFSSCFIYAGVRRMLSAGREQRVGDAMLWGMVGIVIGVAGLVGAAWVLTHPFKSH